jgi:hypothetical protein
MSARSGRPVIGVAGVPASPCCVRQRPDGGADRHWRGARRGPPGPDRCCSRPAGWRCRASSRRSDAPLPPLSRSSSGAWSSRMQKNGTGARRRIVTWATRSQRASWASPDLVDPQRVRPSSAQVRCARYTSGWDTPRPVPRSSKPRAVKLRPALGLPAAGMRPPADGHLALHRARSAPRRRSHYSATKARVSHPRPPSMSSRWPAHQPLRSPPAGLLRAKGVPARPRPARWRALRARSARRRGARALGGSGAADAG